jgi:hypothetical protein
LKELNIVHCLKIATFYSWNMEMKFFSTTDGATSAP